MMLEKKIKWLRLRPKDEDVAAAYPKIGEKLKYFLLRLTKFSKLGNRLPIDSEINPKIVSCRHVFRELISTMTLGIFLGN